MKPGQVGRPNEEKGQGAWRGVVVGHEEGRVGTEWDRTGPPSHPRAEEGLPVGGEQALPGANILQQEG